MAAQGVAAALSNSFVAAPRPYSRIAGGARNAAHATSAPELLSALDHYPTGLRSRLFERCRWHNNVADLLQGLIDGSRIPRTVPRTQGEKQDIHLRTVLPQLRCKSLAIHTVVCYEKMNVPGMGAYDSKCFLPRGRLEDSVAFDLQGPHEDIAKPTVLQGNEQSRKVLITFHQLNPRV